MKPEWLMVFLTLALVILTGAYVWAAHGQLKAIERQGDIAERQIAHLERPRLIVERRTNEAEDHKIEDGFPPFVRWTLVNGGRSPAIIIEENIELDELEGDLPADPPYWKRKPRPETILAANGRRDDASILPPIGSIQWGRLCCGGSQLLFFGLVRYRDTFSDPVIIYEHAFCYVFNHEITPRDIFEKMAKPTQLHGRWVPGGPPSWTKNT